MIGVAEAVQTTLSSWQQSLASGALRLASEQASVPAVLAGDEARAEAGILATSLVAAQKDGVGSTLAGLARVAGAVASCKSR